MPDLRPSALLFLAATACPKTPPPAPETDPVRARVGVWYGSGANFPEGRLCLIFCPNSTFYAADTTCEDLEHPDYRQFWTIRVPDPTQPDHLIALPLAAPTRPSVPFTFTLEPGAGALATIGERANLPLDRIGDLSPLCLSAAP